MGANDLQTRRECHRPHLHALEGACADFRHAEDATCIAHSGRHGIVFAYRLVIVNPLEGCCAVTEVQIESHLADMHLVIIRRVALIHTHRNLLGLAVYAFEILYGLFIQPWVQGRQV